MDSFAEAFEAEDRYGDVEHQGIDHIAAQEEQQKQQQQNGPQPPQQKSRPMMMSKNQLQKVKAIQMKNAIQKAVNRVLEEQEEKLDKKIEKLSNLNEDEMEELRAKRLEDLKKKQEQRSKWLANNHGVIHEIMDQKQFFENVKSTKHVICLFYTKTSKWSHILQEHLQLIAQKHLECKFIQIESQYAPFLIERLNIWMMPTLVLSRNYKVSKQLHGLDWVAADGKIKTEILEQKLFEFGFLEETYIALENQIKKYGTGGNKKNNKYKNMQQQDDDSEDDLFDD